MRLGVFTSGGDAPGMNACVRSVVRTAIHHYKMEVFGIRRGYCGLLDNEFVPLGMRSVSNIIQTGGTILETGRSQEFRTRKGRKKAAQILRDRGIHFLIGIGGDGTFHGLYALGKEENIHCIGLPGTIDNDLYGTDATIGFDTACNTALEALDRIRDTAAAHERVFIVEVMGRHAGFIGLDVGIGSGAEEILIPEVKTDINAICKRLAEGRKRGKKSNILIVSEGDDAGGAIDIGKQIKRRLKIDFRVCILGHVQRGGSPTMRDRVLASKLGYEAVVAATEYKKDIMVGEVGGKIVLTKLKDTWQRKKHLDRALLRMSKVFAH